MHLLSAFRAWVCQSLTRLTEEGREYAWNEDSQSSFEEMKTFLVTAPILSYPSATCRWIERVKKCDWDGHRTGIIYKNADVLSRRPCPAEGRHCSRQEGKVSQTRRVTVIDEVWELVALRTSESEDPEIGKIFSWQEMWCRSTSLSWSYTFEPEIEVLLGPVKQLEIGWWSLEEEGRDRRRNMCKNTDRLSSEVGPRNPTSIRLKLQRTSWCQ